MSKQAPEFDCVKMQMRSRTPEEVDDLKVNEKKYLSFY